MTRVYEIKITGDGQEEKYRFACRSDEPLLNGIRRAFCTEIPRGCSGGGCGVCKVVVKSGEAFPFKPMSREHISRDELARNIMLACCVNPRSDMEIGFFCNDATTPRIPRIPEIPVRGVSKEALTNGSIAAGA